MNATVLTAKTTGPELRLKPIDRPGSLKLKLIYWYARKFMGKVITPLKVIYARFPEAVGLSRQLLKVQEKCTLNTKLKHLIKVYIATLNGCAFCMDIGKASARKQQMDPGAFDDILRFEKSPWFSEAEKAALYYVQEVTQNKHVSDATFSRLQNHYSEREIVEITILNSIENFYNLSNAPLNIGSDELCELLNR